MGRDVSLHPLIRDVNQVHHDDEWRHIIMGRKLVGLFYDGLRDHDKEVRDNLDLYLRRYIVTSAQSLYNPAVYRDAGIQEPYQFRESVLNDPARAPYHETFFKRITGFLTSQEIISASPFTATEAS
jgi:hypothetical protein